MAIWPLATKMGADGINIDNYHFNSTEPALTIDHFLGKTHSSHRTIHYPVTEVKWAHKQETNTADAQHDLWPQNSHRFPYHFHMIYIFLNT